MKITQGMADDYDLGQEYIQHCNNCNKRHFVRIQADRGPSECKTSVYYECECGAWVMFVLRVN